MTRIRIYAVFILIRKLKRKSAKEPNILEFRTQTLMRRAKPRAGAR